MKHFLWSLLGLFLLACHDDVEQSSATTVSTLNINSGKLRITVEPYASAEFTPQGEPLLKILGRSNQPLKYAFSWVPDDAFGETELLNTHEFTIALHGGHEVNSILSGLPISVTLQLKQGSVRTHYLRIFVQPQFNQFNGSKHIFIEKELTPVYVRDDNPLRYRGFVTTKKNAQQLQISTDDDSLVDIAQNDSKTWQFDWQYRDLQLAAWPYSDPVYFMAQFQNNFYHKTAHVVFKIKNIEITTEDPYNAWLETLCEQNVLECLQQHQDTYDLGICGTYRQVQKCFRAL